MPSLLLLRHAKSSWDDPALDDHDRPLAPRGRRATGVLAAHIRSEGIQPALVLCSSSTRTLQTLEGIELSGTADVQVEDELYGASEDGLLQRLHEIADATDSVMVIGHNPAIGALARLLARDDADLAGKYPTGGLATLEFSGSWRDLAPGGNELTRFVTPKGLAAE
jgi:phosphohistidine phosphatase